ncbi:AtpZ/AtpI family protein [Chloroflexota bacterium]
MRFIGVGWYVGSCIILGVLGGLWLDNKFNTSPFLILAGLLFGLGIAFYGMYRMLLPIMRNKQNKEDS